MEYFGQFDFLVNAADVEAFVDKRAEDFLKEELALLPGFRAIGVPGDGNCLAHAMSKAMVGVELLYHALRQEVQDELRTHKEWYRQKIFPFYDDDTAYEVLEGAAREAVPDAWGQDAFEFAEYLGPIHVHGVANVLRRPVVLLSAPSMWERSLAGVYLPERRGPVRWTAEARQSVLDAADALLAGGGFEGEAELRHCRARAEALAPGGEDTQAEAETVGAMAEDVKNLMQRVQPSERDRQAWQRLKQAIDEVRLRTPLFISWASQELNHYVCVVPVAPEDGGNVVVPRQALPNRDGEIIVFGEGNDEATAMKYLEGGEWTVRGNLWPNREQFIRKLEEFWKLEHPDEDLQDTMLEKGWNMLLPNLFNNVLDIAQLFKTLHVEDDKHPVWMSLGSTRVLVPQRVQTLSARLPGLRDLLLHASDRMRPIWISKPDNSSVLVSGKEFEIEWGTLPRIADLVEKKTGLRLEEQMVEIGWLKAGSACFSPNIAMEVPFHKYKHTWRVPANFKAGFYWIAVRLLPFEATYMEGAGPPGGSFEVVRGESSTPDIPRTIPEPEVASDMPDENTDAAAEQVEEWDMYDGAAAEWKPLSENYARVLSEMKAKQEHSFGMKLDDGNYAEVDLDQMKWNQGLQQFAIRTRRAFVPDEEAMEGLIAMGFDRSAAREALEATYNDLEMAALWLTEHDTGSATPRSRGSVATQPRVGCVPSGGLSRDPSANEMQQFDELPPEIQRVFSGGAASQMQSGASAARPQTFDLKNVPTAGEHGKCTPVDDGYLEQLEREAEAWKRHVSRIEQLTGAHADSAEAAPDAAPALARLKSDQVLGSYAHAAGSGAQAVIDVRKRVLLRSTTSPPVLSGINKKAWATMWTEARRSFATPCSLTSDELEAVAAA